MNKKKKLIIFVLLIAVLFITGGIAFGWFVYNGALGDNILIAGNMYLRLDSGSDNIVLPNAAPESSELARLRTDNVLTFSIVGLNTSDEDIYYQINLSEGTDKTGTRLAPDELAFDLYEVVDGADILLLDGVSYQTLNNTKMWVDKVSANTTTQKTRTYKLRAWVSRKVVISDTYANRDYTPAEYKNCYATVKISVEGELKQKDFPLTFTYNDKDFAISILDEAEENDDNDVRVNITTPNNISVFSYNDTINNSSDATKSVNLRYTFTNEETVGLDLSVNDVEKYGTDAIFEVTKNGSVVQKFIKTVYPEIDNSRRYFYVRSNTIGQNATSIVGVLRNTATINNSDDFTITITSDKDNVQFTYNSLTNDDLTDDFTINKNSEVLIPFVLSTTDNVETDTILSVTVTKGGEVVQEDTIYASIVPEFRKSNLQATLPSNSYNYTGNPIEVDTPTITGNDRPIPNDDISYTYYLGNSCQGAEYTDDIIDAGSYSILVTVVEGETYNGLQTCLPFTINKINHVVRLTSTGGTYDHVPIPAEAEAEDTENVTINYYTNSSCTTAFSGVPINAGTYYAQAVAAEDINHNETKTACTEHVIASKPLDDPTISKAYAYNASTKKATITLIDDDITLTENTDYTYTSSLNTSTNMVTVTITGKGNYTGTVTNTFNAAKTIVNIPSSPANKTYKAASYAHGITIPEHVSIVTASSTTSATNVGTYSVVLALDDTSAYEWSDGTTTNKTITWKIVAFNISSATVSGLSSKAYTGSAITQAPTVKVSINSTTKTLTNSTDYTYTTKNNTNVGTATITITGKGNYTGTKTATFSITALNLSNATISGLSNKAYIAAAITQAPTVKMTVNGTTKTLTNNTDYTYKTTNNTNVGTATVTVTGKGNYTGTKTATFKITALNISGSTVSGLSNKTYTGKAITQTPTVKMKVNGTTKTLKNGTDFTYTTKNNTNVGTATVTITGKGNYTGTKTATFKICKWVKTNTQSQLSSCTAKAKPSSPSEGSTYVTCSTYTGYDWYTCFGYCNDDTLIERNRTAAGRYTSMSAAEASCKSTLVSACSSHGGFDGYDMGGYVDETYYTRTTYTYQCS